MRLDAENLLCAKLYSLFWLTHTVTATIDVKCLVPHVVMASISVCCCQETLYCQAISLTIMSSVMLHNQHGECLRTAASLMT